MIGATFYLIKDVTIQLQQGSLSDYFTFPLVFAISTYLLYQHKVAPQWIALCCFCLGGIIHLLN